MSAGGWIRQVHRWVAAVFILVVAGIVTTLGLGREPAEWVYFLPLAPLALLALTGIWLFVEPYLRRRG